MLVVVPARGGSTRVSGKNLRPLAGKPLLRHTLDAIAAAGVAASVVVSTNDGDIAAEATEAGVAVLERPAELATATASTEAVLLHALDSLSAKGHEFEWVMTLPPTSPLRRPETIRSFAAATGSTDADCLFSVHEDRGDYWLLDAGRWRRLMEGAPRRQQDRTPLYEENSAVYVTRVAALRATGSILGHQPVAVPIDPVEGFDINVEHDLAVAEALLAARSAG